jgi:hypothetical protein
MSACKEWSQKLDLPGYVQVCAVTYVTLFEWLGCDSWFYRKYGLPDIIQEALKYECRRVVDDINKKREEEVTKLKLDGQTANRHSTMRTGANPLDKVFK